MKRTIIIGLWMALVLPSFHAPVLAQAAPDPLGYTIATPRPINPAAGTTNPNAQATQSQNPYLGSVPSGKATNEVLQLSLREAIERGLRYNLGLIESSHSSADVRAQRLRALSALLPDVSMKGEQVVENLSFKEIGLKLPPIPGFRGIPDTTGLFGFQETRVNLTQSIYSAELRNQYQAEKKAERASALSTKDARDVVVYAVGIAYLQVAASAARMETAKAQLASAQELDQQTADRVKSEVSPEIDSIRARVQRQTAEQRVTNATNDFEKDKLTLVRIIGLPLEQKFALADPAEYRPMPAMTEQMALAQALESRADLQSAEASVRAAEYSVRAQKSQRLPAFSVQANYGGAGVNVGGFSQVYTVAGSVSMPIYTGGRIQADIDQAQSNLTRRQAEYEDLKGRIAYDVRVAWLDVQASETSVKVAQSNRELAARALVQSQDRYRNGVTNYLEVLQAQEAVTAAGENYIQGLYSLNTAKLALARAMGAAERRFADFVGGN
jgi:outer membrane protein TolC